MYTDPSLIREHVVKVRFNDAEQALIDAFVNFTGQQKAALVRELVLEAARRALVTEHAAALSMNEVPHLALFGV
jgi:hypothetical protein